MRWQDVSTGGETPLTVPASSNGKSRVKICVIRLTYFWPSSPKSGRCSKFCATTWMHISCSPTNQKHATVRIL